MIQVDKSGTLGCHNDQTLFAYGLGRDAFNMGANAQFGMSIEEDIQPPMTAKGAGGVMDLEYIVRRLTPTECARLQGFPDWWCEGLEDDDFDFWRNVWDEYSRITGSPRKTDNAVRAWMKKPHSDAAEYKMWGNGVALPCVSFILGAIADYERSKQ